MGNIKPLWIAVTDLRKLARERRTIVLTLILPVIVVIVVGTTFSLGYQQFEGKELAVGVVTHKNSTYSEMIIEAIENQSAQAIPYDSVDRARADLIAEKIDAVIEVDPWITEKMRDLKRSWIAIHTDETRPLLSAAIEVAMLEAKDSAVQRIVGEYVARMSREIVPKANRTVAALDALINRGMADDKVRQALDTLASLAPLDDGAISAMSNATEQGLNQIAVNGTPQEKIIVSMVNRSVILGTLRSLARSKPLLDAAYGFLRYAYPYLDDPSSVPLRAAEDLSHLTGNLSEISPEQATVIKALLPLLRDRIIQSLATANPELSQEELERSTDDVIGGASRLMDDVINHGPTIANLSLAVSRAREGLASADTKALLAEAKSLLKSASSMEEGFITSPIYLLEKPLYFGSETRRYVDYISPGIFAFGILFSVLVYTVLSVVRDREKGLLRRIFICNVNRWTYVAGKCLVCLVVAAVQISVLTAFAMLLFHIYIVSVPKTFLFGLYASIGFVGLGLLISSISKTELEALTATFGICFIMLIISGVFYPFELSPSIVKDASRYVPITYVADLLKAGMIKDSSLVEVGPELISVGIYGGVTLLIGVLAFRWRKKG